MANNWQGNPYVIDSAENKDIRAKVSSFEWRPAAKGNDLSVKDGAGNILYQLRATAGAPNFESYGIESKQLNRWVDGINIETIDGGTLLIYWE